MKSKGKHTWFDWVVVDRLWDGKNPGREPTYPEIEALLARAARRGLDGRTLARRIGKCETTVYRWMSRQRALDQASSQPADQARRLAGDSAA